MFGTIAAAGIKTLSRVEINNRTLLIIATSIGLGLGVTFRPEFVANLPEGVQLIFASGISTGTITALVLNKLLKNEGEDENEEDLISMQRRNVNQYAGGKNEESSTGRWGRG